MFRAPNVEVATDAQNKYLFRSKVPCYGIFGFFIVALALCSNVVIKDMESPDVPNVFNVVKFRLAGVLLFIVLFLAILAVFFSFWMLKSEDVTANKNVRKYMLMVIVGTAVSTGLNLFTVSNSSIESDAYSVIQACAMRSDSMEKSMDEMQRNLHCCLMYDFYDMNNVLDVHVEEFLDSDLLKYHNRTPIFCLKEIEVAEMAFENIGSVRESTRFSGVKYYKASGQDVIIDNQNNEVHLKDLIENVSCFGQVNNLRWNIVERMLAINGILYSFMAITNMITKKFIYTLRARRSEEWQNATNHLEPLLKN